MPCPVQTSIAVIGGKWKPGILYRFRDRSLRLSEMRREMPWVSEAVLVRMLREMEADGLISRHDHGTWPRRVDYALTDYGKTVIPILDAIAAWGNDHLNRIIEPTDSSPVTPIPAHPSSTHTRSPQ